MMMLKLVRLYSKDKTNKQIKAAVGGGKKRTWCRV
jgi:hypothetical protein